jgi:hypothetical protein
LDFESEALVFLGVISSANCYKKELPRTKSFDWAFFPKLVICKLQTDSFCLIKAASGT